MSDNTFGYAALYGEDLVYGYTTDRFGEATELLDLNDQYRDRELVSITPKYSITVLSS